MSVFSTAPGTAGVALAMWHCRRSLLKHCSACAATVRQQQQQQKLSKQQGDVASASGIRTQRASAAAPAGPSGAGHEAARLAALPVELLAAALKHARAAAKALTGAKGVALTHGSRGGSMLDGGAGVHMTLALVLHDAAVAEVEPSETAVALRRDRDTHVRAFLEAYPVSPPYELCYRHRLAA